MLARIPNPPEQAEHLADGGIRVGEIVAHRWWRLTDGELRYAYLRSCLRKAVWAPPGILEADHDPVTQRHGIYCFKTREAALEEPIGYILGRCAIWGRVVEHANGYRAQFARPVALDIAIVPNIDLSRLRRAYGLPLDGSLLW